MLKGIRVEVPYGHGSLSKHSQWLTKKVCGVMLRNWDLQKLTSICQRLEPFMDITSRLWWPDSLQALWNSFIWQNHFFIHIIYQFCPPKVYHLQRLINHYKFLHQYFKIQNKIMPINFFSPLELPQLSNICSNPVYHVLHIRNLILFSY